jgi:hypothetical protein
MVVTSLGIDSTGQFMVMHRVAAAHGVGDI